MATLLDTRVGSFFQQDGAGDAPLLQHKSGELSVADKHGRFQEACYRGSLFSNGMSVTALSANTITLTNTTTPILGVWNPATSPVSLVILQASLQVIQQASSTATGAFVWATSTSNGAISTGTAPFNRKTFLSAGSQSKGMAFQALTGLTNNLVIQEAADFFGLAVTTAAVPATSVINVEQAVQNFDGSLIVPPGGILALLNTTSTANVSVSGRLMWEEIPS